MQAISEALIARGRASDDIKFVGSRRGQEATLLANAPIELTLLPGRGIRRSLSLSATLENVAATMALARATWRAWRLLRRWRPGVVASVGGYASLAVDVAAVVNRTPLVLVDLDAVPSSAHRVVRRFARRLCVAYPNSDPRAVLTGAPLRREITSVDRSRSKSQQIHSGVANGEPWTVVVMTGSLGSRVVNDVVVELARLWKDRGDLRIVHVTGRRDFGEICAALQWSSNSALEYEIVAFADMGPLWAVADLAICRAGATTVAELTYLGIPSILIPLPGAPNDHQTHNAASVAELGGSVMVTQRELTVDRLAKEVDELLSNPSQLLAMGAAARTLRHENASDEIAKVVLQVAT
jgi:UDP-N-acetylglucosamine--N-acetylmuramyl-(pentapeptide) pyrophosphoryl-undecaprenol N-acetylglucosamine transferase